LREIKVKGDFKKVILLSFGKVLWQESTVDWSGSNLLRSFPQKKVTTNSEGDLSKKDGLEGEKEMREMYER